MSFDVTLDDTQGLYNVATHLHGTNIILLSVCIVLVAIIVALVCIGMWVSVKLYHTKMNTPLPAPQALPHQPPEPVPLAPKTNVTKREETFAFSDVHVPSSTAPEGDAGENHDKQVEKRRDELLRDGSFFGAGRCWQAYYYRKTITM